MKKSLLLALFSLIINIVYAQNSTFDTDDEGWIILGDTQDTPAIWESQGGNPGGYAKGIDQSVGGIWYYLAPPKFLGDKCSAYKKKLSFDLKTNILNSGYDSDDVILSGGGFTIAFDFPNNPVLTWTRYMVNLDESANWRLNSISGAKATKQQIITVLSNLTVFKIKGEFAKGIDDEGGLDNVIFPSFPVIYDLDKDDSSKALIRDFNSDTICGSNSRFRICDNDLSLFFGNGNIDSIVIAGVINPQNYVFTVQSNSPTVKIKGQSSSRLVLSSNVAGDSTALKIALLSAFGIASNVPKPPAVLEISVKLFVDECTYDAICTVFVFNNLVFDLDKNNSTKALGNDYNGDTLCINDNRFAICDSDVSLNIAGLIDSIVIQSATPNFDNYIFQTTFNSTTAQIKGQNTKKLIITDNTQNDTTELKKILLTINGILPPNIKPPTEFRISVKIYQGGCEIEAICYIRSYIRVTIGKPRDTILCHNNKQLNLFELLSGNDVTIGTWTPKLSTGTTFFDPKIDKPGVFTYELKGAKGCPSDSVKVKIGVVTVPSINLGEDTIICEDSTLTLNVPFTFEKYLWQDGSTRPDYRVSQAGTYHVVASTSGCISSDTIRFRGINCRKCKFFAPNAFTPDANGTNDDFRLYSDCIPSVYKLQIYNRWGDLMFETTDFNEGWDGVFKGRAQLQGIYVYLVEIQTDYIEKPFYEKKKGDFMLMR